MPTKTAESSVAEVESLLSRTLVAPVLFISFIFSLFLVDRQTSSSLHPPNHHASNAEQDQYYHAHQRKLAKRQMDDAFALRGRVIVAMCVLAGVGIACAGWVLSEVWHLWNPYKYFEVRVGA